MTERRAKTPAQNGLGGIVFTGMRDHAHYLRSVSSIPCQKDRQFLLAAPPRVCRIAAKQIDMNKQQMFLRQVMVVLAAFLGGCATPQSPGGRTMIVKSEKLQTECRMIVTGKNYTPNKQVAITITNFPRVDGNISRTSSTDFSGSFTLIESFAYRVVGRDETFINILVTGRDTETGQFVIQDISAEPYLIRR
jgi:hypothetical protein